MATQFLACASATHGTEFWNIVAGLVTADASVVRGTNPRSFKLSTSSPAAVAALNKNTVMADAGRRWSFWVRFPSVTPTGTTTISAARTSGGTTIIALQLLNTGKLILVPVGATAGSGTTTLLVNTWYRVSVCYTITNATTFEIRVYLNGSLEISVSNSGTLSNVGTSRLQAALLETAAGANFLGYFDEFYVDDDTSLADPGNIAMAAKLPAALNTGGFDTTLGTGAVDERPISLTNGKQHAAISDVQENYTLQAANVGDTDISGFALVARTAWIWAKQTTGAAGTPKIMDDGTETAVVLTTAAALYTVITDSASYPSNAAGIGMRSANHANDTFLYECGTMIAYIAATVQSVVSVLMIQYRRRRD